MRIKGTERTSRQVEIEIDAGDALQSIRDDVYRSLGIRSDAYLNHAGHLVYDEEHYHGSDTQTVITKTPTDLQVKTIEAFRHIYAMMIRD